MAQNPNLDESSRGNRWRVPICVCAGFAGGMVGAVVGWIIGATYGAGFATTIELAGLRGYEATGG